MAPKAQQVITFDLNANLGEDRHFIHADKELMKQNTEKLIDLSNLCSKSHMSKTNISSSPSTTNESTSISSPSTTATTTTQNQAIRIMLDALGNTISNVMSPAMAAVMIATPIAVSYPLIQLALLLTLALGTSPLYFIMITFLGNNKSDNLTTFNMIKPHHRRQPSLVGSIESIMTLTPNTTLH